MVAVRRGDDVPLQPAGHDRAEALDNRILLFKQEVTAPARLAGGILLVHETLEPGQASRATPGSTTPASAACAARPRSPTTTRAPPPTTCAPATSSTCSTARPTATTGSWSARRRSTSPTTATSCSDPKRQVQGHPDAAAHQPRPPALRAAPRLGRRRHAQAGRAPHLQAAHVLRRRGQLADPAGRPVRQPRPALARLRRSRDELLRRADDLDRRSRSHTDLQAGRYLVIGLDNESTRARLQPQAHRGGLHSRRPAARGRALSVPCRPRRPARSPGGSPDVGLPDGPLAARSAALAAPGRVAPRVPSPGAARARLRSRIGAGRGAGDAAARCPRPGSRRTRCCSTWPSAATRLVAVGERGHILVSSDRGATWTPGRGADPRHCSPASGCTTSKLGWAVGHDETILRTARRRRDLGAASHCAPEAERPLLDVWFADAEHGFAIGAYGAFLVTADGGATLGASGAIARRRLPPQPRSPRRPTARSTSPPRPGTLYRSDDGGESWRALPSPYDGSFFGVLPLAGDALLAFGLRGHLFRSDDARRELGARSTTGTEATLTDGRRARPAARVVVAGLAGVVLRQRRRRPDASRSTPAGGPQGHRRGRCRPADGALVAARRGRRARAGAAP